MGARLVYEGSMEDSYIFNLFNENKETTTKMLSYIKTGVPIEEEMIEEQLLQIKRSRISPLAETVLQSYAKGEIELLYNKAVKVPIATPFIVRRDPSFEGNVYGIKATIFISNFSTIRKTSSVLDIPMKNLYVLMESAYLALYSHTHPSIIERNYGLMKIMCSIYTSMFTRILNKEYSLSLDQSLYDKTNFIISRFFLEKIWGIRNKDVIFNSAMVNIQNPNVTELNMLSQEYDEANIQDIGGMLLMIQSLSPRLNNLSVRYIIQRFMTTYHGASTIAMDYLPYLFFVVINTLLGGFLLNQTTLADIIKNQKMIRSFYPELSKMIL